MKSQVESTHLIQFTVENYRSIREPVTLSMVASPKNKTGDTFDLPIAKERLLKTAVIFGINAGGKSNLLRALFIMDKVVNGVGSLFDGSTEAIVPFRLDDSSHAAETIFEITIEHHGRMFVHGFSADSTKKVIAKEWLKFADAAHPNLTLVFDRTGNDIKLNSNLPIKAHGISRSYIKQIVSDVPFVTSVSKLAAHSFARELVDAWQNIAVLNPIGRDFTQDLGHELANNPQLKHSLIPFVQMADLNISDIDVQTKDKHHTIRIGHKVKNKNRANADTVYLNLESEESTGTHKFLIMAMVILYILNGGGVLAVDELGSSLHPKLLRYVVMLFKDNKRNVHDAQLIMTGHEINLIEFLSRDEVYFASRNSSLATELYSLSDFKGIRPKSAKLAEKYLRGDYGAVPEISDEV